MTQRVSWWGFAARNLRKNPRRTAFTVLAVAIGYNAVTLFGGFTSYIFTTIREVQIYLRADGHLEIFKPKFLDDPEADPKARYLDAAEQAAIAEVAGADPDVIKATRQLHFKGLLSNGETSSVFMGSGKIWADVVAIQKLAVGIATRQKYFEGEPIRDDRKTGVGVGFGLARILKLKMGGGAIALTPSLDGQINALDVEVVQFTQAPADWLSNMLVTAPLGLVQELYDTDMVDACNLVLCRGADLEATRTRLLAALRARGLSEVGIRTWLEMSPMYVKTEHMFSVIFLFVFGIIATISVVIVVNTTSMSIVERTREIGTLRALGLKRRGVLAIFVREGVLMSMLGSLLGAAATVACWAGIESAGIMWTPPTADVPIPLVVELVPAQFGAALGGMLAVTVLAVWVTARRAARMGIVDSLGHV